MYFVSFLVAIISGLVVNQIYNPTVRKIFSTTMGFLIQIYMYGKGKIILRSLIIIRVYSKPLVRDYFIYGHEIQ